MSEAKIKEYLKLSPVEIFFGRENLQAVDEYTQGGNRLIITGRNSCKRAPTQEIMSYFKNKKTFFYSNIDPNPDIDALDEATSLFREKKIKYIVALGGGSAIDSAKALSATLTFDFDAPLSKIFRSGHSVPKFDFLKLCAIPTTSGTGSEVTPFATIWDKSNGKKHSLSDRRLYPKYTVLVPELTLTLPREQTLYTALDSLSHALESIWNKNSSSSIKNLAEFSIELIVINLVKVLQNPSDLNGRTTLQFASMLSGIAISKTKTAIAHSISYPLTGRYGVPHGLAASFTLLALLKKCKEAGFQVLRNQELLASLNTMLFSFNLAEQISKFASNEEVLSSVPEMTKSERAENFLLEVRTNEIHEIIKLSI